MCHIITVHAGLCIPCKVRKNMIQKRADPFYKGYGERREQQLMPCVTRLSGR